MNMLDSDKECCTILANLLIAKGVKRIVLSPGSRNAPLIVSFARRKEFEKFVVLDERSAAFMAMGIAQQSGEPVAVVCTSGTALLNYAPAVAEAYYQHIPLIVISADRPEEWIDQEDSQTLRQKNLFAPFVKASYSLPPEITCDDERWWVNRLVNDAVNLSVRSKPGPVHINVPLREPLYCLREVRDSRSEQVITSVSINTCLNEEIVKELSGLISRSKKVMILVSFGKPDSMLSSLLNRLSSLPQVIVLTETISNLCVNDSISTIDRVLSVISDEEKSKFTPDLLITFGGSLVSRMIKQFLRKYSPSEHWSLDENTHVADTMQCMTRHIRMNPVDFFSQIIDHIHPSDSYYHNLWIDRRAEATDRHEHYLANVEWSDLKAFSLIFPAIPQGSALQLSNSTPVRYAQLFELKSTDYKGWARGLQRCGYATDKAYASKLIQIIELYDLYQYDRKGRSSQEIPKLPVGYKPHQVYRSSGLYYIEVRVGDNLKNIGKEFGISVKKLCSYNEIPKDYPLDPGMVIYLEKKNKKADKTYTRHIVSAGESMHDISQIYGIRMKYLYKMNHKDKDYVPSEGDVLILR